MEVGFLDQFVALEIFRPNAADKDAPTMNQILREIAGRSKAYDEADFLTSTFGAFLDDALLGNLPVVLHGAGSAGKELCPLLRLHGIYPVCFCDRNPALHGQLYCGLPVLSVSELFERFRNSLILVATNSYRNEIKSELLETGFDKEKVLIIQDPEAMCYYTHLAKWYWSTEDLNLYSDKLQTAFDLLADEKSREIFSSIIALFHGGSDYGSFLSFISRLSDTPSRDCSGFQEASHSISCDVEAFLQFNNDIISINPDEILIDAGAYTGDSTIEFIKACARDGVRYRKIFCYEPDKRNFAELKKNTSQYDDVFYRPFGLWSHPAVLTLDPNLLKPQGSKVTSEFDCCGTNPDETASLMEILVTSIDDDLPGEPITTIKMDIEESELYAIAGAKKTITYCRPKLIISAYHKRNDIFEIPLKIHEISPDYNLYLRHFSNTFAETTVFAIPR